MNVNKKRTSSILKSLAIFKLIILGFSFYLGTQLFLIVGALWLLSFLVSENHLMDFCKNGKLVRYGGTVDYIDDANEREIEQSYNAHMWTVYVAIAFMLFAVVREFIV